MVKCQHSCYIDRCQIECDCNHQHLMHTRIAVSGGKIVRVPSVCKVIGCDCLKFRDPIENYLERLKSGCRKLVAEKEDLNQEIVYLKSQNRKLAKQTEKDHASISVFKSHSEIQDKKIISLEEKLYESELFRHQATSAFTISWIAFMIYVCVCIYFHLSSQVEHIQIKSVETRRAW